MAMFTCARVSFTRSWPAMAAAALLTAIRGPDHAAWRTPPAFPPRGEAVPGEQTPGTPGGPAAVRAGHGGHQHGWALLGWAWQNWASDKHYLSV